MSNKTTKDVIKDKYKFTFVVAVYNSEDYLAGAIDSVINQTLNFVDNVQIILVNDGSTDSSSAICSAYQERFPDNIIYIEQENKGVSAARNAGISRIEGRYTSFLDSDDRISLDTLQKVEDFFASSDHETDVASIKFRFFGAKGGGHTLNYKFKTTRVVDLIAEYDHIQLSACSSFIRTASFKGRYIFDESIRYYEDVKFMVQVLANRMTLGVVSEPIYYYRRRDSSDSAVNLSKGRSDFYVKTLENAHAQILKYAKSGVSKFSKYAQYIVMYDLQFRFKQTEQDALSTNEEARYKQTLVDLLQNIGDDIILQQRNIYSDTKMFILGKKHGVNVWDEAEQNGYDYTYKDNVVYSYKALQRAHISSLSTDVGTVTFSGIMRGQIMKGVEFGFIVNGVFHESIKKEDSEESRKFLGEEYFIKNSFTITLAATHQTSVVPAIKLPDGVMKTIPYQFNNDILELRYYRGASYLARESYILCRVSPEEIVLVKNSFLRRIVKKRRLSSMRRQYEDNRGMPKEYKAVEK